MKISDPSITVERRQWWRLRAPIITASIYIEESGYWFHVTFSSKGEWLVRPVSRAEALPPA